MYSNKPPVTRSQKMIIYIAPPSVPKCHATLGLGLANLLYSLEAATGGYRTGESTK